MKGIPFDGDRVIIKDGAMGTSLMRLGPASTDKPERMNLRRPEIVQGIHAEYLQAGCDIVTANTFNVNSFPDLKETESVIQAGIRCAREAANRFGRGWIAMDLGPTGKIPEP
ncbi:MAG: homocysteine S-methyltransferase family protein, partial [Clostridia bacterium]|nr:homocysteine S-methyltransferase family protein [Clostridia bacterium]